MIPGDSEIVIANRQRARGLNQPLLNELIQWLLFDQLKLEHAEIGFHFVAPKEMARVHQEFMDIKGSTDVITFDHGEESGFGVPPLGGPRAKPPKGGTTNKDLHGEIYISVQDAIAQAAEFKTTWQSEITRYLIHGILHLLGYDDLQPAARAKMKRAENSLLRKAARKFSLRQLEKK
jgi:probable rRNA maturation factor